MKKSIMCIGMLIILSLLISACGTAEPATQAPGGPLTIKVTRRVDADGKVFVVIEISGKPNHKYTVLQADGPAAGSDRATFKGNGLDLNSNAIEKVKGELDNNGKAKVEISLEGHLDGEDVYFQAVSASDDEYKIDFEKSNVDSVTK